MNFVAYLQMRAVNNARRRGGLTACGAHARRQPPLEPEQRQDAAHAEVFLEHLLEAQSYAAQPRHGTLLRCCSPC
jgi:hypothetical protein